MLNPHLEQRKYNANLEYLVVLESKKMLENKLYKRAHSLKELPLPLAKYSII